MPEAIIFEDAERQIIRATSDDKAPGEPGYSESTRTVWKAGSRGDRRQQAVTRLRAIANAGGAPTAADIRFIAKVLAVVLTNVELDPDG